MDGFVIFIATCGIKLRTVILVSLYCCFDYPPPPLRVRVDYFTFWSQKFFEKLYFLNEKYYDGIINKVIKLSLPAISLRICSLFNQCVNIGYFLQSMKVATIMPLFKGGLRESLENYKPISLLSSLSKMFERIIFNRLYNFANK